MAGAARSEGCAVYVPYVSERASFNMPHPPVLLEVQKVQLVAAYHRVLSRYQQQLAVPFAPSAAQGGGGLLLLGTL